MNSDIFDRIYNVYKSYVIKTYIKEIHITSCLLNTFFSTQNTRANRIPTCKQITRLAILISFSFFIIIIIF